MGSITKQIRKRAGRFKKALDSLEKNLDDVQDSMPASFERYDLAEEVRKEIEKSLDEKRKFRNKKKAERRQRRG